MRFESSANFDAPADAVFAVMCEPDFQAEKIARTSDLGGPSSVRVDGDRTLLHAERSYSSSVLPDVARRFVGEKFTIVEDQSWGPADASGNRTGRLEMHISGQPLTLMADLSLTTVGSGSQTRIAGELKARVPLIGGKIESAAAPLIKEGVNAEGALIRERLAR